MTTYLVVGIIILVALIAVAISVAARTRRLAVQNQIVPEDELAEFKRMHEAGEISEEEYRKMKKIVAEKSVQQARGD